MTDENTKKISDGELDSHEDLTVADPPEGSELGSAFWVKAKLHEPQNKQIVTIRLDDDIIQFFKKRRQGKKGYQTDINSVLRTFVDAHKSD